MSASVSISTAVTRLEPLSPFVRWSKEDLAPVPEPHASDAGSLAVDLLRDPNALVLRILDAERAQSMVLGALALIGLGTSLFAAVVASAHGGRHPLIAAAIATGDVLLATAAALGPIYAVSILVAARMPMSRLVATLLGAAATCAMVLAALGPLLYFTWRFDDLWAGPVALFVAFLVSAASAGVRIRRMLNVMAEEVTRASRDDARAELSTGDRFRVGIVARMAMVLLGFTMATGFFAFNPFF